MRKQFYSISLLLFTLLLGLSSCSKEVEVNSRTKGSLGTNISFSIDGLTSLRATTTGNVTTYQALAREKSVSSLNVVLFKDNLFYKVIEQSDLRSSGSTYTFDALKVGTFSMYLVANPSASLTQKLKTAVTTESDFESLIATQKPGEDNTASGFLMTSEKKTVTTVANSTENVGTIKLERVAARIDLYNRIPELEMTKVTFKNRYETSRLRRGTLNKNMNGLTSTNTKTYDSAAGLESSLFRGGIYGYENLNTESGKETRLVVEGLYNGHPISHEIVFNNLPLKRNHLYSVVISRKGSSVDPTPTPDGSDLTYNIYVNDWNEDATIEWKGDNLIKGDAPEIQISTESFLELTPNGTNPTTVKVTDSSSHDIIVTVKSDKVVSKLVTVETQPDYLTIAPEGTIVYEGDKIVQKFRVSLTANSNGGIRKLTFKAHNALDPTISREFSLTQGTRPKLAIEYVAEYNINKTGDGFATSHANDASGYFNWYELTGTSRPVHNPSGYNVLNKPVFNNYHLPSVEEMAGIFPGTFRVLIKEGATASLIEAITIKGENKTYRSDYKSTSQSTLYALRFQSASGKSEAKSGFSIASDNSMRCAYRYEYLDNSDGSGKMLKITVRYLGEHFLGDIDTISNSAYWSSNSSNDIIIKFAAAGKYSIPYYEEDYRYDASDDYLGERGTWGSYAASLGEPGSYQWLNGEFGMSLYYGHPVIGTTTGYDNGNATVHGCTVRLFRNN